MQKKYVIEIIVDYADPAKFELITAATKQGAAQIYAKTLLIRDEQKPRIAVYSEDFFAGRDELDYLVHTPNTTASDNEPISDEMLELLGKK